MSAALNVTLALAMACTFISPAHAAEPEQGVVKVVASMEYPDGSMLKFRPVEVQLVKAEQMQKSVAGKVALGVLLFAVGGGTGFTSSSKDNMVGTKIEGIDDRSNLQIVNADAFAASLQISVQAATRATAQWTDKIFKNPIHLAGGAVNLVYEGLTGEDATRYRLKADWVVYKRRESFSLFGGAYSKVDCSYESSTPMTQAAWAESNYALVKAEMDAMLPACEAKVLAALPELLKN